MIVANSPFGSGLASMGGGGGGAAGAADFATALGALGFRAVEARLRGLAVRTFVAFLGREGLARPDRPKRCTLPMTAFRVTPPSCFAIWLADKPSAHNFVRISTRSSVQAMSQPFNLRRISAVNPQWARKRYIWYMKENPLTRSRNIL